MSGRGPGEGDCGVRLFAGGDAGARRPVWGRDAAAGDRVWCRPARLHCRTGVRAEIGLQARTARMSISDPPLQQLPSGDWKIRRCLVADPGKVIVASDYSQVEMRVLAALCGDETLQQAIVSGADLHDFTAERVFGP